MPNFAPPPRKAAAGAQTGARCWAPHPAKAFTEATVKELLGDGRVKVSPVDPQDGEPWECMASELLPRAEGAECKANMDDLPELHMAGVLANVEELYHRQQPAQPGAGWSAIYTSVGPVLIAMNPFKQLPLYGPDWASSFRQAGNTGNLEWAIKSLGPHCYATVEQAYQGLRSVKHQSVIICGESGAGKTVTNRKMIEYLLDAEVDGRQSSSADDREPRGRSGSTGAAGAEKRRIAEANALLEAFGNAKTVRNDNSSRFGKYSQLHFTGEPLKVRGFEIEPYLLEQSRIVSEPSGERNYHIFHQLTRSSLAAELGLEGGPQAFEFTRSGAGVKSVDGSPFDDGKDFEELTASMEKAGFDKEAQRPIFEAIAAVLHLGNVKIDGDADNSKVSPSSAGPMSKACELLGLEPDVLGGALVKMKTAMYTKNLGASDALSQRDVVAKAVYSRVFHSVVDGINSRLQRKGSAGAQVAGVAEGASLGLLDIFGFEDMPVNGLEQMYINLTNERIQYLFNTMMFERELAAYRREGVEAQFETPPSNLPCVELFTSKSPPGVVKLLAAQVSVNGKDGSSLVGILNSNLKDHAHYTVCVPKMMTEVMKAKRAKWPNVPTLRYDECFQVRHYAGEVIYTVRNFLAKSKDSLLPHLAEVLQGSKKPYVQELFAREAEGGKLTVGEKFSRQLEALSEVLEQGGNLFVRCIKPNPASMPGLVNRPLVLEQLVCGGVVAALEMRKYGFPDRLAYATFVNEFWILDFGMEKRKTTLPRRHAEDLLSVFVGQPGEQYAFGDNKVFMRAGVLAFLRALVAFKTYRFAILVQRKWRIKKHTEFIHAISSAREKCLELSKGATVRAIAEVAEVAEAAGKAQTVVDGIWRALEEARERHAADTPRTATPKVAVDIGPMQKDLPRLKELIEKFEAAVAKVEKRKAKWQDELDKKLAQVRKETVAMLERVGKMEEGCSGAGEGRPEHAASVEACQQARQRLDLLCRVDLPRLQEEGPQGMDLSREPTAAEDLCPQAGELLAEATALVDKAEERSNELGKIRFQFDQEATGMLSKRDEALKRLEALQAETRAAILEGLDGVGEALQDAWSQNEAVAELQKAAQDPEGFMRAIQTFEDSVIWAEKAVDRAKNFRASMKREEEKQLQEAFKGLDQHEHLLHDGQSLLAGLVIAEQQLEQAEASEANKKLRAKIAGITAELRSLGITEVSDQGQPTTFGRRSSARQDWEVECTHLLGEDISSYLPHAKLLDKQVNSSISLAVQGLNDGVLRCDEGACIVFSASRQSYYLLYTRSRKEEVFKLFKLKE